MAATCPSWESVLAALHGESAGDDAARARAHASACPVCGAMAQAAPALEKALRGRATPPDRAGAAAAPGGSSSSADCPPPEVLAAFAAGGTGNGSREAIEAHMADCAACRADVAAAVADPAPASEAVSARNLARARALFRMTARRTSPVATERLPAVSPARAPREWKWAVPVSLAAGLLGGIVAVRWLPRPAAPPDGERVAEATGAPAVAPEEIQTLDRRVAAAEARHREIEQRLGKIAASENVAQTQSRTLASSLDDLKQRIGEFDASMRALSSLVKAQAAAREGSAADRDLTDRLARIQAELDRMAAAHAEMQRTYAEAARELAESRLTSARQASRIRDLEDPVAKSDVDAPSYEALFNEIRQGAADDYKRGIDQLRSHGLDSLGYVVAYYHKDTPKDRRAQAGEELNRRGAKTIDHDLILAMAHRETPVRRESFVHLAKYRARQDFKFNPSAPLEERQRELVRIVRWWEGAYHAEFPEKAQLQQGPSIIIPGTLAPNPLTPGGTGTPSPAAPNAPVPPQYAPPPPQ